MENSDSDCAAKRRPCFPKKKEGREKRSLLNMLLQGGHSAKRVVC